LSIKELRQNVKDGSTLHFEMDLRGTNIKYQTAANLGVYPENDANLVTKLANFLGYDLNKNVKVEGAKRIPFPSPISVRNILTKFCDF